MIFKNAIILAASLFAASTATAAEYVVKQGDTLVSIAEKTGHTPEQIVIMNAKHDWVMNGLSVGTRLTYVSRWDIRYANKWCRQRLRELPESDPNATIFAECVADTRLRQLHIRYALNEPSGTHFNSVFAYANAYRERPRSAEVLKSAFSGMMPSLLSPVASAIASDHSDHKHPEVHIFKKEDEK